MAGLTNIKRIYLFLEICICALSNNKLKKLYKTYLFCTLKMCGTITREKTQNSYFYSSYTCLQEIFLQIRLIESTLERITREREVQARSRKSMRARPRSDVWAGRRDSCSTSQLRKCTSSDLVEEEVEEMF